MQRDVVQGWDLFEEKKQPTKLRMATAFRMLHSQFYLNINILYFKCYPFFPRCCRHRLKNINKSHWLPMYERPFPSVAVWRTRLLSLPIRNQNCSGTHLTEYKRRCISCKQANKSTIDFHEAKSCPTTLISLNWHLYECIGVCIMIEFGGSRKAM